MREAHQITVDKSIKLRLRYSSLAFPKPLGGSMEEGTKSKAKHFTFKVPKYDCYVVNTVIFDSVHIWFQYKFTREMNLNDQLIEEVPCK